jgi:hypothetical protein
LQSPAAAEGFLGRQERGVFPGRSNSSIRILHATISQKLSRV